MKKTFEQTVGDFLKPVKKSTILIYVSMLGPLASQAVACETDSLCKIVLESSVSTFENATLSSVPQVVDQRRIVPVDPVRIPDFFQGDSDFSTLVSLDDLFVDVPDMSGSGAINLDSYVELFVEKIELEEQEEREEPANVTEARTYLFAKDENPSAEYKTYLEFSSKYQEKLDELSAESNESAKNLLRIEIEQIERDWELFGNRPQVEAALSIVERFEVGDTSGLFEEWKDILEISRPTFSDMLETGLGETNWIAFGYTSTDLQNITVELVSAGESEEIEGLNHLSFSAKLVPVGRNYLYHPFISSRGWKTTDGSAFLALNENTDAAQLGWYVLGAIVVKNLEILTDTDIEPANYDAVSVFPTGSKGSFQTKSVSFGSPYIIALVVEKMKRFPTE